MPPGVALEGVQHRAALLLEGDKNEGGSREAGLGGVQQGDIAVDQSALLERTHPAQAGGRREVDALGELHVGYSAVAHQLAQDRPVEIIKVLVTNDSRVVCHGGAILCDNRPRKSRKSATACG